MQLGLTLEKILHDILVLYELISVVLYVVNTGSLHVYFDHLLYLIYDVTNMLGYP